MPSAAQQLTEAHRQAQRRLAAVNVSQMHNLWPLLDLNDLDGTFDRWLRAAVPVVAGGRDLSSRLAANYYSAHRALTLGVAVTAFTPVLASPLDTSRLTGTLLVTGPAGIKNNIGRGVPLQRAATVGQAESARAAVYLAQAGGRDTVTNSTAADPKALGWARATSGDSCAFCLALASRGPVYSEGTVDFEAHPSCSCTPEPAYSRTQEWPPGSREAKEMWADATRGTRGDDALNAFRRAIEADRRTPAADTAA